jgi:RNA polymerase sigma-70 factor (sigma-E family)
MSKRDKRDKDFEEFAVARTPDLYRSAWLLCGDRHQADDLVQETLAKVYARWQRPFVGPIDNPAAYAQTTLMRTFLSGRRKRANGELSYAEPPDTAVPDGTETSDVRLVLVRALAGLAPADRAVVVLRYLEDLSVEETAARLGTSSGAVRNRSMRALAKLRDVLEGPQAAHTSSPEGADHV